jgi:hypothetical protein
MELIGRYDTPDRRAKGERFSDIHDVEDIELSGLGLRGLRRAQGEIPEPVDPLNTDNPDSGMPGEQAPDSGDGPIDWDAEAELWLP